MKLKLLSFPDTPSVEAIEKMWGEVEFVPIDEPMDHRITRYIDTLKQHYVNGDVLYWALHLPDHETFNTLFRMGSEHEWDFFRNIFTSKGVKENFPYKLDNEFDFNDYQNYEWRHALHLAGELSCVLYSGGAYHNPGCGYMEFPSVEKVKSIGDAAAEALLEGQLSGPQIYMVKSYWCDFFYDVAWDYTFFILDHEKRTIRILMATDTD